MEAPAGDGQQKNGMKAAGQGSWIDPAGQPVRKIACKALVAKESCKKRTLRGVHNETIAAGRCRVCEFMKYGVK